MVIMATAHVPHYICLKMPNKITNGGQSSPSHYVYKVMTTYGRVIDGKKLSSIIHNLKSPSEPVQWPFLLVHRKSTTSFFFFVIFADLVILLHCKWEKINWA